MAIKAIQTQYKNHHFRSRLEARWAVYFERLGLKWEYEVEGYRLDDGTCYLPDFKVWTPQDQPMWIEVKASNVKRDPKFEKFKAALDKEVYDSYGEGEPTEVLPEVRAYLVSGTPLDWFNGGVPVCPRCGGFESDLCHPCDNETPFGGSNQLDETGIGGVALNAHKGWIELRTDRDEEVFESFVLKAATAAQQARFEHGESPESKQVVFTRSQFLSFEEILPLAKKILQTSQSPQECNFEMHKLARLMGFNSADKLERLVDAYYATLPQ